MPPPDSAPRTTAFDPAQMARARMLLRRPADKERVWPTLCAAAFAACTALMLATATILAPPVVTTHVVHSSR